MDEACHTCEGVIWCVTWDLTQHRDITEEASFHVTHVIHVCHTYEGVIWCVIWDLPYHRDIKEDEQYVISYNTYGSATRHSIELIHITHYMCHTYGWMNNTSFHMTHVIQVRDTTAMSYMCVAPYLWISNTSFHRTHSYNSLYVSYIWMDERVIHMDEWTIRHFV